MTTLIIIFLTILAVLFLFYLSMVYSYKGQVSDTVTLAEMEMCERVIHRNFEEYLNQFRKRASDGSEHSLDIEALARDLGLQVEESYNLPQNYRGSLNEATSSNYNGLIQYSKDKVLYAANFDITHEIIHYLVDIGKGKQVSQSFARLHHGNSRGHREQIIDYYAAAVAIPQADLRDRLSNYAGNPYDEKFVLNLMEIYKQPKDTIVRRIGEVLALS